MRLKLTTVWNLRSERSSRLINIVSLHVIVRWRHRCHHTYGYIGLLMKKNSRVWRKVKRYFVLCWTLIKSFWEIRSCSNNHFCNLRHIHTHIHTHTPIGYRKYVHKRRFRVWHVDHLWCNGLLSSAVTFVVIRFNPAMKLFQTLRKKNSFIFYFRHTSFIVREVKLVELAINSFEWKNPTLWGRGSIHTLTLLRIFTGSGPHLQDLHTCKQHVWIDAGGRDERCA